MLSMIRLYAFQQPTKTEQTANLPFVPLITVLALFMIGISFSNAASAAEPAGFYLIGTIVSKAFTGAVIKDGTGMQSFFRLHEALPDGSKIVRVQADSISLKGTDGSFYDMFISHEKIAGSAAPPQISANSPVNITPPSPATSLASPSHLGAGYFQRRRQRRHIRHSSEEDE